LSTFGSPGCAEVVAALKAPDLLEQFVERIRSDTAKWARVIQAAGLKQQ
jgi:hypothetical protein